MGLVDRASPGRARSSTELARQASVGLVGGELDNLPVRAGSGDRIPLHRFLASRIRTRSSLRSQERLFRSGRPAPDPSEAAALKRWLRRCRVTHLVDHRRTAAGLGTELGRWRDPALDRIVYHAAGEPASRLVVDRPGGRAVPRGARGRPRTDDRRPPRARSSGCRGPTTSISPGSWPRTGSPIAPTRGAPGCVAWDGRPPRRSSTTAPATW